MEQTIRIPNHMGETLVATVTCPDKIEAQLPIVIMAPGFGSKRRNSTNVRLTNDLVPRGIATLMLDLSGHGESEGDIAQQTLSKATSEIACVVDAVRRMEWVDTDRVALAGNSFSGNAMLLYSATDSHIRAIALRSPITNYKEVRERQLGEDIRKWQQQGYIAVSGSINSSYQFYEDAAQINTYAAIPRIKAPILVVQGDHDEDIPMSHVAQLGEALNDDKDRLFIIPGADHGYTQPEHFNRMISLIEEFLIAELLPDKSANKANGTLRNEPLYPNLHTHESLLKEERPLHNPNTVIAQNVSWYNTYQGA